MDKKVVLLIDDLFKSYGKKDVIRGLSLEVYEGEVFGLIGKNGIGKSTTIDCVIGSKVFQKGRIEIDGISISNQPLEAKKKFGYVPSEPCLYEMMTGYEYLSFIASIYGVTPDIFKNNVKILIDKFSLTSSDLNNKIKEYSHGMKQKLALMSSLIHNPKIWVLDEPTVGLDIMVYQSLVQVIKEFSNHNKTVFVTSHNLDMVAKICDRVAIINEGKIVKLIDLNKEPYYRGQLSKVFFEVYKRDDYVS